MTPGQLIRDARLRAGLTQKALALRTGTTQSAIARLEADRTNPTVETLQGMLHATGEKLSLGSERRENAGVDESLIREHLSAPREQRLAFVEHMYKVGRELAEAGARGRGELVD